MFLQKKHFLQAAGLLALALTASCGGGGGGGGKGLSIAPAGVTLTTWDTQRFTASEAVYWDVVEPGGGFFGGAEGVYTASSQPGTYHVVAKKQSNTAETATATVRVVAPPVATITCPDVVNHGSRGVTASVAAGSGFSYTWSLQGASILSGQSTPSITFDAPATGTLLVGCSVRNEAGKVDHQSVSITVAAAPAIASFSASPSAVLGGQTTQLTASFTGATAQVDGVGSLQNGVALPVVPPFSTTYTLRVANLAGEEVSSQCSVQVAPVVTTSDPTPVIAPGGTLALSAAVIGSANTGLTWAVQETGSGVVLTNGAGTWTATMPATPGTYHLIAQAAADPTAQAIITATVFAPFSSFRVGAYAVTPLDDSAVQPTAFGWARQSRFAGPRNAAGPQMLYSLPVGSPLSELVLGPRGEFYTPEGKKWDTYGAPIPAFQPANTYFLTAPFALDRQGRALAFDDLNGVLRLCALDAETGALSWATPVAWQGGESCRLIQAEDGRMVVWNNWDGQTGNTLVVLSSEGATLWSKSLPQFGEVVFSPDGGLLYMGYQVIIKWDANGAEVWRLVEDVRQESIYNGYHPRAVISSDGTLYTCSSDALSGGSGVFGLTAVSADGHVLWRAPIASGVDPYLALSQDGTIVCGLNNATSPVMAFDAQGQLKWKYDVPSGTASYGEPLIDRDGYVYVAPRAPWPNTSALFLAFSPAGAPLWSMNLPYGYYAAPKVTLGARHELYLTWDSNTLVLADPPAQP
ncbi:MAG TPA: hypothetical protein VJ486_12850 [Geothrix sp.]|nr:hypothetical protein [Geothrix sp.]